MDELDEIQKQGTSPYLFSLVMGCRRRYLDAAYLLEIDNEHVQRIGDLASQRVDLSALLPAYDVLCQRYRDELHSWQDELWQTSREDRIARAWSEFYYWRFVPTVIWEDTFVCNVLRGLGVLPARNVKDAIESLRLHVSEMQLPRNRPPTDDARRIDR